MNIKKWFARAPKYAPQVIDTKVLSIINQLDSDLVGQSTSIPADGVLVIKSVKIGLFSQHFSVERIAKEILLRLDLPQAYIPRSIAFLCNQDGDWCFYFGFRASGVEVDTDKCDFFNDILIRTNNARA